MISRVIIESPYAGDVEANIKYARACVRDSIMRGEAPIVSHLLYTQDGILNDNVPEERELGISAGVAWYRVADLCVVYSDHGITHGMFSGIYRARCSDIPVIARLLRKHDIYDIIDIERRIKGSTKDGR